MRRYELFLSFHLLGSAILVSALFIHTVSKPVFQPPMLYILIAVSLRGLLSLLHFASLFYHNVGWSRWLKLNAKDKDVKTKPKTRRLFGSAKAHVVTYKSIFGHNKSIPGGVKYTHVVEDAIYLYVYPSRSWTFRPGQFVYISLPELSKMAFA